MNNPPAFQFYPAEYLADENVAVMTLEEEGAYWRAVAYCWREGSIPADDERLSRLLKGASTTVLRVVRKCFNQCSTTPDRLVHPRLEKERIKQAEWRAKSAAGGKRSGKVRRDKKLRAEPPFINGSMVVEPPYEPNANSSSLSLSLSEVQIPSLAEKREREDSAKASPGQPAGPVPEVPPVPPEAKPPKPPTKNEMREKRHAELKAAISAYWQFKNPNDAMPWDGAEGKNLGIWMQASPDTTIEQFRQYLVNRSRSEVNHAERPSKWIRNITDYAAGPLDRFNKPLKRGGYANGPPSASAESEAYERKVKAIMAERKAHS